MMANDQPEFFREIASSIPGYVFRYRRSKDGSEVLDYVSPGFREIWEATSEEDIYDPKIHWARVHKDDHAAFKASIWQAVNNGTDWNLRYRILLPSGQLKWLHGRGKVTPTTHGGIVADGIIMDVTDQVETERHLEDIQKQLAQAQKLESVGRLAGGIAHDFNNLLAIILGNAETLEDQMRCPDSQPRVTEIVEACRRGGEFTRQLLGFARQSPLAPALIDVNATISQFSSMLTRVIPSNIRLETVLAAGLWNVEIDRSFLESALVNLCINARDAMEGGGKLTVETCNMRVTQDYVCDRGEDISPGRYVLIAVSDTGRGIPGDDIAQVIEPFFTTKGPELGSGLGLAMVDGFIRQSNGALRIYSELGVGTTIKMYLPAVQPHQASQTTLETSPQAASSGKAGRVLVVEDEPSILRILKRNLTKAGYDVLTASSGDSAFESCAELINEIDILLTDVVMPGTLQGPALAQQLTALNPELKVVFMSGYANEAAIHGNGLRANDHFLMKPVTRKELLATLETILTADGQKN